MESKLLFISIPKNASRHIRCRIGETEGKFNHLPRWKFHKIWNNDYDEYHSFAFIRRPDEYLQSWVNWHKGVNLMEWARNGFPDIWWGMTVRQKQGVELPYRQSEYVKFNGKIITNWLFDFDDLNKHLGWICNKYEIGLNKCKDKHQTKAVKEYNPELEELSRETFAEDWELYENIKNSDYGRIETIVNFDSNFAEAVKAIGGTYPFYQRTDNFFH